MAKWYPKAVTQFFAKHPQAQKEGVTVGHLHSMLDDLVDSRIQQQKENERIMAEELAEEPRSSGARSSMAQHVAYPAIGSGGAATVTASQVASLERVDFYEGPRVFVVLDEGCNRMCHGEIGQ